MFFQVSKRVFSRPACLALWRRGPWGASGVRHSSVPCHAKFGTAVTWKAVNRVKSWNYAYCISPPITPTLTPKLPNFPSTPTSHPHPPTQPPTLPNFHLLLASTQKTQSGILLPPFGLLCSGLSKLRSNLIWDPLPWYLCDATAWYTDGRHKARNNRYLLTGGHKLDRETYPPNELG